MNAFKGIITLKPSVQGCSLNLNSSVIEGLINHMLDSVLKQHRICVSKSRQFLSALPFFFFALFFHCKSLFAKLNPVI